MKFGETKMSQGEQIYLILSAGGITLFGIVLFAISVWERMKH